MTPDGIAPSARSLLAWGSVPVPLATAALVLRFVSRRSAKAIGTDDWCMLAALFLYYGLFITIVLACVLGGYGWPQDTLSSGQLSRFFKLFFCMQFFYGLVGPAIKLSFLLLYRRIFTTKNAFLWSTIVVGSLVLGWSIAVVTTVFLECQPFDASWHPEKPHRCINSDTFYAANAISNMLLDFVIFAMPIPIVWALNMSTKRKLSVIAIFALGVFVCAASIIRITYLPRIQPLNVTGTSTICAIWTSIEPGLGIVAGCMPTFIHLFRRDRPIVNRPTTGTRLQIFERLLARRSAQQLDHRRLNIRRQLRTHELNHIAVRGTASGSPGDSKSADQFATELQIIEVQKNIDIFRS